MRYVLLIALGLLFTQEPTPIPTVPGRIAGTVRHTETGNALKDAVVTLSPPIPEGAPVTAVTDKDGRFLLDGVPPGTYSIIATLDGFGYIDPNPGTPGPRGPYVSVGSGQRIENITVKLAPAVSVSGRILDKNGQPLTLTTVTPAQKTYDANGVETVIPGGGTRAGRPDANGNYRILGLLPGQYYIMTSGGDGARTYYPGVRSLSEAVPVLVSGTDLGGIDFRTLPPLEKYSVRFRVTGIVPMPRELNLILRSPAGLATAVPATTIPPSDDGWFTIPRLSPADYDLTIQWTNPPSEPNAPPPLAGRQVVSFSVRDRDLDLGTITLRPPGGVTGHVTFKAAAPFRLNVLLMSGAFDTRLNSNWWLSDDNMFDISFVTEGRYTVGTSFLPEGQFLASATYNNVDVLGKKFSVNGTTDGRLDLVIDGPAGKLSGKVVNAKSEPVGSVSVVLLPPADRRDALDSSFVARTDQAGSFAFDRVAPGEYTLLPLEVMPQYAYKNDEWLKRYEPRGVHITVQKGAALEVVLKVIPTNP